MTIDKAGNVGIGTNSPKSILNLYTANPELIIQDTETSSQVRMQVLFLLNQVLMG